MRHDGSILWEPGYDEKTGVLFDSRGVVFPRVPDQPTREHAKAALDMIAEPISQFPFEADVDQAVAISAVLTAMVRRSLSTAPNHAFNAPAAGTGKSKLMDYASVIATGEKAPVVAQGANDEETEKRLVSCLLDGRAIIAIDNCTYPLSDIPTLCQALTQEHVSPRILGLSKAPTLSSKALFMSTGNGLVIVGDLVRRSLRCGINAGVELPEGRRFAFDPVEVAKSKRPELAVAALTILRAFHVAGRPAPEGVSPLGSFENWSLLVRNALIWLGCADPVASQRNLRKDDPDKNELQDVMTQWWEAFGSDKVTVAEVIHAACAQEPYSGFGTTNFVRGPFRDALLAVAGAGGAVNGKRLGRWLLRYRGRVIGDFRFELAEQRNQGAVWRLAPK